MSEPVQTYPHDPNPEILDPLLEPYKVGANDGVLSPEETLGWRRVHKLDGFPKTLCQEY